MKEFSRFLSSAILPVVFLAVTGVASGFGNFQEVKGNTTDVFNFKMSARGLLDRDPGPGTSDPYIEVFITESFTEEINIGHSNPITNTEYPDWPTTFEFRFNRDKNQSIVFVINDKDTFTGDDLLGVGWINLNSYMDNGQFALIPLDKRGHLVMQSVETNFTPISPLPSPVLPNQRLRFKLYATNLPTKDVNAGGIDSYAEIFVTTRINGGECIGTTSIAHDNLNPMWNETFEVEFTHARNPRLIFKIWDSDRLRKDEDAGFGWLDMKDYIRYGQFVTIGLSKQGTLTVERAE